MDFYSKLNGNEIKKLTGKWMELEIIILSEVTQTWKQMPHALSHLCISAFHL